MQDAGYEYDDYADALDAAIDEVAETGDVEPLREALEEEESSFSELETEFIDPIDPLEWEESLVGAPAEAEIESDIELVESDVYISSDPELEVELEVSEASDTSIIQQQWLTEEDFAYEAWETAIEETAVENVAFEDLPQLNFEVVTSESGAFSGVKSRFQSMSETSDAALWESAAAEFELLAEDGYDFYAADFAGEFSEALTEEMVDSILEDVVEDAAESIVEETLEEGAGV